VVSGSVVFVNFIDLFVFIFNALLVIRVVMSYFAKPEWRFWQFLVSITEPLLAPVRSVLPRVAGADFAPLVTFFLLEGIQALVQHLTGM
jgi:YggT family protein